MTTMLDACAKYKLCTKYILNTHPTTQFYQYRAIDDICAIERLCYKIGKAVLKNPGAQTIVIQLKPKQSDWLTDRRDFKSALLALQMKYINVDLKVDKLTLTIIWKSKKSPILDPKDHLNSKLFRAILSNRRDKVARLLNRDADPNAIGPFEKRPIHAVLTNPELFALLLKRGADPEARDSLKLTPLELIQMQSGSGTEEEELINDYIAKKNDM